MSPDPVGAAIAADPKREQAFAQFWGHVGPWIASGHADPEDVAHEAYCAGWDAARVEHRAATDRILVAFAQATVDPEISAEAGDRIRRAFGRALSDLLEGATGG